MSWTQVKNYDIPIYIPASSRGMDYKLCRLPNGILTMVISDPSREMASCSLSVATGSHNDPSVIPGLAHLCEHMILSAGSKKYPDPNSYHKLISESNGSHNAYTTGEQTTFYFEIPCLFTSSESNFERLLDIFSSSFKDPLFKETSVNKEIYAIESEHDGNTCNLTKILYHATRLLANSKHPFSRFSTGNITTLGKGAKLLKTTSKKLLESYFKTNYNASNMTLCIKGPQSVNVLTKYALTYFNGIDDSIRNDNTFIKSLKSPVYMHQRFSFSSLSQESAMSKGNEEDCRLEDFHILSNAYNPKYKDIKCFKRNPNHNAIFIKSTKQPILRLLFPIDMDDDYFNKDDLLRFIMVWCELFGDENDNSLCYFLKKDNLITDCFAFHSNFALNSVGLVVELSLTGTGVKNQELIINSICNSAIEKLSEANDTELARFLSECNTIDIIRFINKGKEDTSMDEISEISSRLQENLALNRPSFLLKEFPFINDYSETGISNFEENEWSKNWWLSKAYNFQQFLKRYVNRKNLRILFLGDIETPKFTTLTEDLKVYSTDPFYDFEYITFKYKFKANQLRQEDDIFRNIGIPKRNTFMPEIGKSLAILSANLEAILKRNESIGYPIIYNNSIESKPGLVLKNSNQETWVLNSPLQHSSTESSIFSFEITNWSIKPSPASTMHLEVLGQLLGILMTRELYPALRLGYTYEIGASVNGDVKLMITISGFQSGIMSLLQNIIKICNSISIKNPTVTHSALHRARVMTRRKYEDAASGNSVKLASVGLLIMLEKHMWTLEDRFDALEESDINSFYNFCSQFFKSAKYIKSFISGTNELAMKLSHLIYDHWILSDTISLNYFEKNNILSTCFLKPGENVYFQHPGDEGDINNCINYFIQTGERNNEYIATLTSLTDYIMQSNLVSELRNRKQVGYVVFGGMRSLTNTIGLHITIMSLADPEDLERSIDEYMWRLENDTIGSLNESTFKLTFLLPFINTMQKDTNNPFNNVTNVNLVDDVVANVQAGDSVNFETQQMKLHNNLKKRIFNNRIQLNLKYNEAIDLNIIKKLTLKEYLEFFRATISINSKNRSKISIHIISLMAKEEIANRKLFLQLVTFLKVKGLTIKRDELKEIVEISEGKPSKLLKEIVKYFKKKDEAKKLYFIIIKEIIKIISMTVINSSSITTKSTSKKNNWQTEPIKSALPLVLVNDIKAYK
ncbi:hypothetical protein TPHA_0D04060 [Tetrapisispora phaffii CBS 4417]|uniref:Peptidase M16 N-terminal domain-containing protein n=1 Tax=Tetrapisispora phaffii (strain ATCC 24235 / CBS 4417 / NBRC 1672 / NRRL Y-8282 / UCD 70-5) TaxID=1071381 RepID=G8BT68_TETPH|nr:hypothetical protein TPHA_0D04060 [Tetrapisispora phaffii CBS 4417]CCE63039.1 hypothetical protein TPHA_0D04060 [Tetrapisispora phaffii CBS 4417]